MMSNTDTNQASEDELQRYHLSSCAKYETLRGIYPNDRRLTGDPCSCGIESLIRTEKLKLLAEVRERVVGEDEPGVTNIMIAAEHAKQIANLTKLEAEL